MVPNSDDENGSTEPEDIARSADAGNMEQLRSLLFGGQMRDYDRRFKQVDERISIELERLSTELRGELLAEREARLSAQQSAATTLDELRLALLTRLDDLDAALTEESASRESALGELADALRDELEARAAVVERALTAERERLRGEKADREELAQLFGDVSSRLARTRDQAE